MTKLEAIEQAVKDLPPKELEEFLTWFEEFEAAAFDAKIERDVRDGKLDGRAEAALKEFARRKDTLETNHVSEHFGR